MRKKPRTASPTKTLILGAFLPEIKELKAHFRADKNVTVATVGIGLVEAALATAQLLYNLKPQRVIFIGSVGAVHTKVKLLTVVSANSVVLKDVGEALHVSEQLSVTGKKIKADERWIKRAILKNKEIVRVDCYTTTGLTRSAATAKRLSLGLFNPVESLELYGVAAACKQFSIPWNSVQVITNHTNPRGHIDWRRNYRKAARITCNVISDLVDLK